MRKQKISLNTLHLNLWTNIIDRNYIHEDYVLSVFSLMQCFLQILFKIQLFNLRYFVVKLKSFLWIFPLKHHCSHLLHSSVSIALLSTFICSIVPLFLNLLLIQTHFHFHKILKAIFAFISIEKNYGLYKKCCLRFSLPTA